MYEYNSIIQSAIKRPTVFLRRNIRHRMISGFNEKLFPLWQLNMDIQFIPDKRTWMLKLNAVRGKMDAQSTDRTFL